jgi:hypothetical protein
MNKYVIIDAESIQKRIQELKYQRELASNLFEDREYNLNYISMELRVLEQFLSQSTPLIPEIEKAFDEGAGYLDITLPVECKKEYISNLKIK